MNATGERLLTESTPLLRNYVDRQTSNPMDILPSIIPLETSLHSPKVQSIKECVRSCNLPSENARTALILLLSLRYITLSNSRPYPGPFQSSGSGSKNNVLELEALALAEWARLNSHSSNDEIDKVLWMSFPLYLESSGSESVNLIHTILKDGAPQFLTMDPRIADRLLDAWRYGRPTDYHDASEVPRSLLKLDRLATPRVLHALELILFSLYLGLLAHYVLRPPISTDLGKHQSFEWRIILMSLYALSCTVKRPQAGSVLFCLTLLSFLVRLPASPLPGDVTFTILLTCLSMHILQLQFPNLPSPIFLFPHSRSLPLSHVLQILVMDIYMSSLAFFLPALAAVAFLLSVSLADSFLHLRKYVFNGVVNQPAPEDTRVAFLLLFVLLILLLFGLAISLTLIYPSKTTRSSTQWDSYTSQIGLLRRAYCAAKKIHCSTTKTDHRRPIVALFHSAFRADRCRILGVGTGAKTAEITA
ncbi:hypothetical protein BD410DRAFT_215627 [Rickenella mellea]|uniref:Uncharacterized protein n=1 Tax=Rickenella mellea TaxID=50990 RepID=A0A4Y7QLT3_9AGAM|nr:hypothetical protein BD410DRAFT_215627 [Rickenella mellea]